MIIAQGQPSELDQPAEPKRFRFGLRAMFLLLTMAAIVLAGMGYERRQRQRIADALDRYRQIYAAADLGYDAVFPSFPSGKWHRYDPSRDINSIKNELWPATDTDPRRFHLVREGPESSWHTLGTGANAYTRPLGWTLKIPDALYETLLFYQGIAERGAVHTKTYTTVYCDGNMLGDLRFDSYATAIIDGDMSGTITGTSYFNLVVTGKFTGKITADMYAMIYLLGGNEGQVELNRTRLYIGGRTMAADLSRIRGEGEVYLEESDLPPGVHTIGDLTVTVPVPKE
jgi:hypothetical protein